MRKIRIIEFISLDGVIQAPDGPKEDGDYPYGGWAAPFDDPAGTSPMADSLNKATKYVATHRPESLEWGPVENPGPDIVEGVRGVKKKAASSGVIVSSYRPCGPLRTGSFDGGAA